MSTSLSALKLGAAMPAPSTAITMHDTFTGTTLNRELWVPQKTATSHFTTGAGLCEYIDDPSVISVANGYLNLSVHNNPAKPGHFLAGEVSTIGKFSQTYGRFEVRAKLPDSNTPGLQETFWLWPNNDLKYGPWPLSGEIDFAEFYSQYPSLVIPYLHYGTRGTGNPYSPRGQNMVTSWVAHMLPGEFNTYGIEWRAGVIVLYVNGKVTLVDTYAPANVKSPAPFDQPFFLALTQAIGQGANAPTAHTTIPATTLIDSVTVWA